MKKVDVPFAQLKIIVVLAIRVSIMLMQVALLIAIMAFTLI